MKKQFLTTLAVLAAPALIFAKGAAPLGLQSELSHPLLPAGEKQTAYLKVSLTGGEAPTLEERAPINVAIVLDRSSSMSGEKMPALATPPKSPSHAFRATTPSPSFPTIPSSKSSSPPPSSPTNSSSTTPSTKSLPEVPPPCSQEFPKAQKNSVNSKTKKPSTASSFSPTDKPTSAPNPRRELGELGTSLAKEGISVTTIGLGNGYNEDLMNKLALNSDGNHSFVATPGELAQVFDQELGGLLSVVAQNITLTVELAEGVRPVRSLGRQSNIVGQTVTVTFNQLYAEQNKFLLLEVETPARDGEQDQLIANSKVSYFDLSTNETSKAATQSVARVTNDKALVEMSANRNVMIAVVDFIANEKNLAAVKLRDDGKVQAAKDLLQGNFIYLKENAAKWSSDELAQEASRNEDDYAQVDTAAWGEKRKAMTQRQNEKVSQNSAYRSKD